MKEKFIKSTIILMVGGFLTKILGMIIKIVMSRIMGTEGIGIYMLILPTFSLFIGLAQFGFPVAVSKLVAEEKRNNKNLIFSLIPISLFINIFLICIILFLSPFLANQLLKEPRSYYGLIAMCLVIPFTSLSSILRSYFFGKQKMFPHVVSNLTEDMIRLGLIILGVPVFLKYGLEYAVAFVILTNVISELTSIIVLYFFLPKNFTIQKKDLIPNRLYIKESMMISIPNTASRFIGSVGYFLEPIVLTNTLLFVGYSNSFIVREYGLFSGYVLPLLLLPSFFTLAISQALLPVVSKNYIQQNLSMIRRKIKQAIFFSLLIGIPITILFMLIPDLFLMFIYHTKEGTTYLKFLAPICLFQYIQSPLSFSLDAMGKSNDNMKITFLGIIIRTGFLFLFSLFKIGIWGLIFATSLNIIITTVLSYQKVQKYLSHS